MQCLSQISVPHVLNDYAMGHNHRPTASPRGIAQGGGSKSTVLTHRLGVSLAMAFRPVAVAVVPIGRRL